LNQYPPDGGWAADQVLAHLIKTEKYLYQLFSIVPKLIRSQKILDRLDWLNTAISKLAGMSFISSVKELRLSHPVLGNFSLFEFALFIGKHKEWYTEQLKRIKTKEAQT